jgi:hypothetical protein
MKETITWWGMVVTGGWVTKDARQTRRGGGSLCTNATADRGTRISSPRSPPPHAPRNHLATNHEQTTAAARRSSNDRRQRCFLSLRRNPTTEKRQQQDSAASSINLSDHRECLGRPTDKNKAPYDKWFSSVTCSNTVSEPISRESW